mgnify:CR=1 FL=1
MTGFGWQEIAVGAVVLASAAWLVRRARRANRERVVCSSCPVGKLPRPYFSTAKRTERTHAGVSTRAK